MQGNNHLKTIRSKLIRELAEAESATQKAKELADVLYELDLTVYSSDYSFDSVLYNSFALSKLDNGISLHPEQLNIIEEICTNDALIVSAPTSFGKTFCIFEYIIRYEPANIVLIVPTLALVDEYIQKIVRKYKSKFYNYKIHTNIDENKHYDFNKKNIFILTHDRVVQEAMYTKLEQIDFLVIDEVYKLETDKANDRVLVLNMTYYYLSKIAKKYVLLAPFIKEIIDINTLEKKPHFYRSDYSPVVNDVIERKIMREEDRFIECRTLLTSLNKKEKTLVYFPTVVDMYKYINKVITQEPIIQTRSRDISFFIQWAKDEIHEDWCLVKALERGYLIHNGQIPVGTRIFQLDNYDTSKDFNIMLCTSTLLEGVNTTAENIIITKPARKYSSKGECFSTFDFFNLVGRTGRLNQHLIGTAYYLKAPNDPEYNECNAAKSIRFEIVDESEDINIQKGNIQPTDRVAQFLNVLHITLQEYQEFIGTRVRFTTVLEMYKRYCLHKEELMKELNNLSNNKELGRYNLVRILYVITDTYKDTKARTISFKCIIINKLLDKRRFSIKQIVNELKKIDFYKNIDINKIISEAIRLKNSYIEHTYYNRVTIIKFFMQNNRVDPTLVEVINKRITNPIEYLYYVKAKNKKTLLDLGIYERDIEKIISIIGSDFQDIIELKTLLTLNYDRLSDISYISRYVIDKLIH